MFTELSQGPRVPRTIYSIPSQVKIFKSTRSIFHLSFLQQMNLSHTLSSDQSVELLSLSLSLFILFLSASVPVYFCEVSDKSEKMSWRDEEKNVHLIEEFGNFEQIRIRCILKCCRRRRCRCQRLLRPTTSFKRYPNFISNIFQTLF